MTGPKIKSRLTSEAETNVSLAVQPGESSDSFKVLARGELQLGESERGPRLGSARLLPV